MNKRNFIILVLFVTLLIGLFLTLETFRNNPDGINITLEDRVTSIITIDINPSLTISLNKNNKVVDVKPLNNEAEKVVNYNFRNKSFKEVFASIIDNMIDKKYIGENVSILLNVRGKITREEIEEDVKTSISEKNIVPEIIYMELSDKRDAAEALDLTETKYLFLEEVIKDIENATIEEFKDRSIDELNQIKNSNFYCDKGYTNEGEFCIKEIGTEDATIGKVCPEGFGEKNKKCYRVESPTEELGCTGGQELVNGTCFGEKVEDAKIKCEDGTYDEKYKKCIKDEYIGDAVEYCRITPSTDLFYNGRCLGRKNTINGKCLGNDKKIDGYCYDTSTKSGYEGELRCPNGELKKLSDDRKCYEKKKYDYTYYCEKGTLKKNKCITTDENKPVKVQTCSKGYTLNNDNLCYSNKETTKYVDGNVCKTGNSRLRDGKCILFEILPAKQKNVKN